MNSAQWCGEYRQEKYDKSSKKTKNFELSQEFIDENRDFAIINYVR